MPKRRAKRERPRGRRTPRRFGFDPPPENRAAEAITVAWTVSITAVLLCDLSAMFAYWYVAAFPPAAQMRLFGNLMLISGSVLGVVCLTLTPVVLLTRRVPPPGGILLFAGFVSAAPLIALVGKIWS